MSWGEARPIEEFEMRDVNSSRSTGGSATSSHVVLIVDYPVWDLLASTLGSRCLRCWRFAVVTTRQRCRANRCPLQGRGVAARFAPPLPNRWDLSLSCDVSSPKPEQQHSIKIQPSICVAGLGDEGLFPAIFVHLNHLKSAYVSPSGLPIQVLSLSLPPHLQSTGSRQHDGAIALHSSVIKGPSAAPT